MGDRNLHGDCSYNEYQRQQRYAISTASGARGPEALRGGHENRRRMYGSAIAASPESQSTRRLLQQQQEKLEQYQARNNINNTNASKIEGGDREVGYYQAHGEPSREYAAASASWDNSYASSTTSSRYHTLPGKTSSHSLSSSSKSSLRGTDYLYDEAYASSTSQGYDGDRQYDDHSRAYSASTARHQPPYNSFSSQTRDAFAYTYPDGSMQGIPEPPTPFEHPAYQRQQPRQEQHHSLSQSQHRQQPSCHSISNSGTSSAAAASAAAAAAVVAAAPSVARVPRLPSQRMMYHRKSSLRRLLGRAPSSSSVYSETNASACSNHSSVTNDQKIPACTTGSPTYCQSKNYGNSGGSPTSYYGSCSNNNYRNNNNNSNSNSPYYYNNSRDNNRYGDDYPNSSYRSSYGGGGSSNSNNNSRQNNSTNCKFIEVMPGYQVPLRGASETWQCVENDFFLPTSCMACSADICCIQDAEYVICPTCKVVSPLSLGGGGGGEDNQMAGAGGAFGAGLGFTFDDLAQWQTEIMRQRGRAR